MFGTPKYTPIAPCTAFLLLTGCRRGEALALTWSDVDLEAVDHDGRKVGEIRLKAEATKTKHARTIDLEVSPALREMLAAMKLKARPDEPQVFGGESEYTVDAVESARARMVDEHGAPKFDWQMLRSTCATYLTNAPSIFGAASVFLSAKQLGHSVTVAERHYLNVHRGFPRDARTLEAAMQIEDVVKRLLSQPTRSSHPVPNNRAHRDKQKATTRRHSRIALNLGQAHVASRRFSLLPRDRPMQPSLPRAFKL